MPEPTKPGLVHSNGALIVMAAGAILAVLAIAFVVVSGYNPFAGKIVVTTYFKNSLGLKSGAAVNLNGVVVGQVKKVVLSTGPAHAKAPVEVTMSLYTRYLPGLHSDSLAQLTSMGAMADTFIDIDSEHATGPALQDGAELPTLNTPTVLNLKATDETTESLHNFTDRLNKLADEAQTGNGSIGQLLSNPGLPKEAAATAAKVQQITRKLNRTDSTAGKILNDHSINDRLASIGTNMQGINAAATRLTNGPLQTNIATTQALANSLTADLHAGRGAAGMITNNPTFKAQLSDTTAQANAAIASIHNGKGTAAKLLAPGGDAQVNLNKLATESSTLAALIRSNPRKYLTIEIRLF
ncbi:MAG TPA: MlaD family protein [Acidobacteriaceae bacterium]|nr:MlaD family protein [Acidobacteriaceae bacterium]